MFSTGDLMAADLDGEKVWARNLGVPENHYGHSSSLITFRGILLVQYDHAGGARLLGLNARTGETEWKTDREVETSWSSPIVVETESGPLAVLCADPTAAGYDPETGLGLWAVECLDGAEVGPSAAYADGLVFAVNDNAKCAAIDLDTEKIIWDRLEELPDCASPLAAKGFLFLASSAGEVTCLEARTGKMAWQQEFDEGFYASPVLAGDRIYLTDRTGVTSVFRAAGRYEPIATNPLGEESDSTPAIVTGRIYLRGKRHLYCVGEK
jgi:outer membrane protein assembly factor BamB